MIYKSNNRIYRKISTWPSLKLPGIWVKIIGLLFIFVSAIAYNNDYKFIPSMVIGCILLSLQCFTDLFKYFKLLFTSKKLCYRDVTEIDILEDHIILHRDIGLVTKIFPECIYGIQELPYCYNIMFKKAVGFQNLIVEPEHMNDKESKNMKILMDHVNQRFA